MKKQQIFWLPLLLVLTLATGMPQVFGESGNGEKNDDRGPVKITMIAGSSSGVWYMVMNAVTVCINKSYPGSVVTVIPGSGLANLARINGHQADGSLLNNTSAAWAMDGKEPFKEKYTNVATIASLFPSQFQLVVDKKLGVKSLDEIIAKKLKVRLSIDTPGSNTFLTFNWILREYGVTVQDFEKWGGKIINKNQEESVSMYSDGTIDGFAVFSLCPAPPIQEAAANRDMVILRIKDSVIDALVDKYGYAAGVIPAGGYKFSAKDVPTVASYTVLAVPKDEPDEVAYKLARSIRENLDYLRTVHAALKDLAPNKLPQNLGVPLHPGAKKFYQDAGILKK